MAASFRTEPLSGATGFRIELDHRGEPLSYRGWLLQLTGAPGFCDALTQSLAALPFAAFAWECRPVSAANLDAPFEMVAIDSPALAAASPDATPFAAQFASAGESDVVTFDNLGGDARLVVPCARAADDCYTHLARFVRAAPAAQARVLWRELGQAVEARLHGRTRPLWVSTAGLGVSWLHVRLDDRPKYYRHAPYRRA